MLYYLLSRNLQHCGDALFIIIIQFSFALLLALALESFGGQRLLQKGDINIGTHANTMFRVKVCEEPSIDLHKSKESRHTTYLGIITPYMLCFVLVNVT